LFDVSIDTSIGGLGLFAGYGADERENQQEDKTGFLHKVSSYEEHQ
jgi:hypothetical protein